MTVGWVQVKVEVLKVAMDGFPVLVCPLLLTNFPCLHEKDNEGVNLGSERCFTVGLVLLLMPVHTQATGTGHNGIRSMHGKLGLAAIRVRN